MKSHEAPAAPPHKVEAVGGGNILHFLSGHIHTKHLKSSTTQDISPSFIHTWMVLPLARQNICSPSKQNITVHQSLTTFKNNQVLLCGVSSGLGILFRKSKAQTQVVKALYQKYK